MNNGYYVYVYIDPRNYEEFYYGKGKGNRKKAHLNDEGDTEKTKRIKAIQKEGLEPIIKVVAKCLSESEAFLIEKTLIWKLGKNLTNISSGHFADKFRPHNSFHLNLNSFDFENGIYFVNVGHDEIRSWDDCRKFGFLSAGQSPKYSNQIKSLNPGDIIAAYINTKGYVGIGRIVERAVRVLDFKIDRQSLQSKNLVNDNLFKNSDNENCEYLVKVEWVKTPLEAQEARWERNYGLFTTRQIKASLENKIKTIKFLEQEFSVNFQELMNK